MTEFAFGKNRLRADVERTRTYYAAHAELTEACTCAYCRNFRAALTFLPEAVSVFLESLGLILERPAEIMEWCREADGRHWYTIQYHLAGELLERDDAPVQIAPEVTAGFAVDSGPFLREFPEPCFQLFLDVHLPWVLEEPGDASKILLQEKEV